MERVLVKAGGVQAQHSLGVDPHTYDRDLTPNEGHGRLSLAAAGRDIKVKLTYDRRDDTIQAIGEDYWEGKIFSASAGKVLHLDASGGDGRDGTDGSGGNVVISVREDDLDLLATCTWDTSGGGVGGGGTRTRETRRDEEKSENESLPLSSSLGGQTGRNGRTLIRVLHNHYSDATYLGCYDLELVSFEIVDENDDGVFEPGEHLFVQNIVVRNKGKMPSPGQTNPFTIHIKGTRWLEPIESYPIVIPPSILDGEEVQVPGRLRAFIRNESSKREPGQALNARDEISLFATYRQFNRTLPSFNRNMKYTVSYPLVLSPPRYLRCVQKGDRIRASWTLRNVSRKPHSTRVATSSRYIATRFAIPPNVFDLSGSGTEGGEKYEAVNTVDELEPDQELIIEKEFTVSSAAQEYSKAELHLHLLLDDPHRKNEFGKAVIRPVVQHVMDVQITGPYLYDNRSTFLLVVNSESSNWAIHQIVNFIQDELRLKVDVFNISLAGSFIDPTSKASILHRYMNKSIIIFGNSFPYFERGTKHAWQLIDGVDFHTLTRCGTSVLFCGVTDKPSLWQWASSITFAANYQNMTVVGVGSLMDTVDSIANTTRHYGWHDSNEVLQFIPSVADRLFDLLCCFDISSLGHGNRVAAALDHAYPLRRFLVEAKEGTGVPRLLIVEALPKTAIIMSSTLAFGPNQGTLLSEHHKYAIINIMPFKDITSSFWSSWGARETSTDLSAGASTKQAHLSTSDLVCLAIEYHLVTEIGYMLCRKEAMKNCLRQLPKLDYFLDFPRNYAFPNRKNTDLPVARTLGTILGSLQVNALQQLVPLSLKCKLYHEVRDIINTLLAGIIDPAARTDMTKAVKKQTRSTKQAIETSGRDIAAVVRARVDALVPDTSDIIVNLADFEFKSVSKTTTDIRKIQSEGRATLRAIVADEKEADDALARHIIRSETT